MVIVVMGVSGVGKTTVARELAERLGAVFLEGDDYHPPANVSHMSQGQPLTEAMRLPWLEALREAIDELAEEGRTVVVAASVLRRAHRDIVRREREEDALRFVYLHAPDEVIRARMAARAGHFMPPAQLDDQLATLESPIGEPGVICVEAQGTPEHIVDQVVAELALRPEEQGGGSG